VENEERDQKDCTAHARIAREAQPFADEDAEAFSAEADKHDLDFQPREF
jgi:hypothetical protein